MKRWLTRRALGGIALGVGILASASRAPLMAHHSFAVSYIEADTIELDGDVVEFQYKNPHSWIFVQATEAAFGQAKIYAAEWVSPSQLERSGIDRKFFKPGDTLRIWASPNKNPGDNRVRLKRMERRSDGWKWTGNRGDTR
jgi:Family of unknown function (DUF6152)